MSRFVVFTCVVFGISTFILFALSLNHEHPEHLELQNSSLDAAFQEHLEYHEQLESRLVASAKEAKKPAKVKTNTSPPPKNPAQKQEAERGSSYPHRSLVLDLLQGPMRAPGELNVKRSAPLSFRHCDAVARGIGKDLGVGAQKLMAGHEIASFLFETSNMGSLKITCFKTSNRIVFVRASHSLLLDD